MKRYIYSSKNVSNHTRIQSSYECQYIVIPWREEDDLNLNPFLSYREAQEAGEEYCPEDEEY